MAQQESGQERNEAPTERRREEARKKGQVPSSTELSNAVILLAGLAVFWFLSRNVATDLLNLLQREIRMLDRPDWSSDETVSVFAACFNVVAYFIVPFNLMLVTPVVALAVAQRGFQISLETLKIDWNKLQPSNGMSRLFSMRSVVRAFMLILNLAVICGLLVWMTGPKLGVLAALSRITLMQSVTQTWTIALTFSLSIAGALLAIGGLDFMFQRMRHEKDLRMTKQELRDEQKEQDIDPQVRARIKAAQREATKQKMLRGVPTADLVIRNPTHIAVALRYDRYTMAAPVVVAKGAGFMAKRIIKIAEEHRITVLERKPLARSLYAMVEVNDEIPPVLFKAIAEVLSYLYGLRRRSS